jgi:hypothetical protein
MIFGEIDILVSPLKFEHQIKFVLFVFVRERKKQAKMFGSNASGMRTPKLSVTPSGMSSVNGFKSPKGRQERNTNFKVRFFLIFIFFLLMLL